MKHKKKIAVALCLILLSVGALAFAGHTPQKDAPAAPALADRGGTTPKGKPLGTREEPSRPDAPEHVIYRQFFRHVVALKQRAQEVERQGRDGRKLRSFYRDRLSMKEDQSRNLDSVAADVSREVDKLDAKAKRIIEELHARYPGGVVPEGEQLPPPPPEFKDLQRQRDYAVMRGRMRLKTTLGEQGFQQVEDFVKMNFAPDVRPVPVSPRRATPPPQGQAGGRNR